MKPAGINQKKSFDLHYVQMSIKREKKNKPKQTFNTIHLKEDGNLAKIRIKK